MSKNTQQHYRFQNYPQKLTIRGQTYSLPIYLPDATWGVVRNLDGQDLQQVGTEGVVINTYHLREKPGIEILKKMGGIKSLMNWSGLTASDSGGFQLFSLINRNPDLGHITDQGVVHYSGKNKQRKLIFTPEDSIKVQFAISADIMICLDDFTPDDADENRIKESVDRTINWAKRCKLEFEKQVKQRGLDKESKPLLFAPIQGHNNQKQRKRCAEALLKIGFDGYGLGGWPFKDNGDFDYEMCSFNASLTPDDKPRFALGVGKPDNIVELFKMGYHIFDCVLPTRDARHNRLYVFNKNPEEIDVLNDQDWSGYLYINRGQYKTDNKPISPFCRCPVCRHYSRAYLNHLFKIKDGTAYRLAELHNLYFYNQVIQLLRNSF
ncbi:MAG: tRNA guanosine(34) transglycosylase Tgt [Patescibacteria group bacterium]|nr:tRNA guanosine(34) transglycosylase Tgt [Patescibacteria group bacterium]